MAWLLVLFLTNSAAVCWSSHHVCSCRWPWLHLAFFLLGSMQGVSAFLPLENMTMNFLRTTFSMSSSDTRFRLSWSPSTPYCSWNGVLCYPKTGSVRRIDIAESRIVGALPSAIGRLQFLTFLNASGNRFSGKIPYELGNLLHLVWLDLSRNQFGMELPSIFASMASLTYLNLASNKLQGSLPSSITKCSKLKFLSLTENRFFGNNSLALLSNLRHLQWLFLSNNRFVGQIPSAIKNWVKLQILDLQNNNFEGAIPRQIESLQTLDNLNVGKNLLSGELPVELGFCVKLRELRLQGNSLIGPIPDTIGQIYSLLVLDLRDNNLSSSIPTSISQCHMLRELNLHGNQLTGSIPAQLGSLTASLQILDLSSNSFTGEIPAELGSLLILRQLYLSANKLSGEIPNSLGNCQSLVILDLSNNELTGSIPSTYGNLAYLEQLNVSYNKLNGSIPEELGQLVSLTLLDLSVNRFAGIVPDSFSSLGALKFFDISSNRLVGPIPDTSTFRKFKKSAFAKNRRLCGWVTAIPCTESLEGESSDALSPAPEAVVKKKSKVSIAIIIVVIVFLLFLGFAVWKYLIEHPEIFSATTNGTYFATELFIATEDFSRDNVIGEGEHYMVYKGLLEGKTVAVKRLQEEFHEHGADVTKEWEILAKLQHPNLVNVLGWCSNSGLFAVVVDFMPNENLETQLHEKASLNWDLRFRVASGVASGLAYLHQQHQEGFTLYCDLTPESILLDDKFEPHISNYGIMDSQLKQAVASRPEDLCFFSYRAPGDLCNADQDISKVQT